MNNSCCCDNKYNHDIIDESNNTILNKILQHYFNQINNNNELTYTCYYCKNLKKLNFNLLFSFRNMATLEEIDIINILKNKYDINKIKEITETWEGYNINKQNKIFNLGLENNWSYKEMIGMIWETHIGTIEC